jgi:hypothetical protein
MRFLTSLLFIALFISCNQDSKKGSGLISKDSSAPSESPTQADTTAPILLSNSISGASFSLDDSITIQLTFNENIVVSGNPRIEITLDNQSSGSLYAMFSSASANQLQFSYPVALGDNSTGIDLAAAIDLNGGSIADAAGNDISLNLITTSYGTKTVDTNVPAVNSLVEPANGTYSDSGGTLLFQVNFSEAVNISGTPRLVLNIGGVTRYATYQSGDGSAGLEFSYTIVSGDDDSDGINLNSTNIDLNGGSITAVSDSANAQLGFGPYVDSMAGVLVDTSSGITPPDQVVGVTTAPTTNSTELSVAWTIPADNGTAIINYIVQYRELGNSTWINASSPTTNTATISGLVANTTYEIRVAANNGLLGSYSNISTAEIFDILALNPIAWLSATDISNGGSEPLNGDKVDSWSDLTGVATDAVETNPANQPEYQTNVQNGLPAVYFNGSHTRGLEGTFTRINNSGLTVFLVGKMNSVTPRRCFFEFYSTTITRRGFFFTYGFNEASTNRGLDDTGFNVWSAYDNGSNTTLWENGVQKYSNITNWGPTAFTGSGAYVLGDDQTSGDQLNGHIGEFLVFDRELTVQERQKIEDYLANKWGI